MHVDHCRGDVGVTYVGLDVGEWEDLDGEGAERVPQVVQPDRLELGLLASRVEAPAQRRVLKCLPRSLPNARFVVASKALAAAELVERSLEDPVEQGEVLVDRPARQPALGDQPSPEGVDEGARDGLERRIAERR